MDGWINICYWNSKNCQCLLEVGNCMPDCHSHQSVVNVHVCCLCVCYIGSNRLTTTVEMRDKCSPRWIVNPNKGTWGARSIGATRLQDCLQTCVNSPTCVSAQWVRYWRQRWCWLLYTTSSQRGDGRNRRGITEFEIVRGCETASGRPWSCTYFTTYSSFSHNMFSF